MDALELSGGSGFGLNGAQIWAGLVEPCALKCAKTRISANDAQIRHPYRKHTVLPPLVDLPAKTVQLFW